MIRFAVLWKLALAVSLLCCIWLVGRPSVSRGVPVTVVGAPYPVGGDDVTQVTTRTAQPGQTVAPAQTGSAAQQEKPLEFGTCPGCSPLERVTISDKTVARIRFPTAGIYRIEVAHAGGTTTTLTVDVQPLWTLRVALLAVLALLFSTPYVVKIDWYEMLSEKGGGYSLSHVQALLWFVPAMVAYGAMCLVTREFGSIDTQLTILLGLSGATTALGAAASPPRASEGEPVDSDLGDLVRDWRSRPDVSRYQYLILSVVGALTLTGSFLYSLELPAVPLQLLYLVGASQGTYLGVKAVKMTSAATAADTATAPAGPSPAPYSLVPRPSYVKGTLVDAPAGKSAPDGSIAHSQMQAGPPQGGHDG